MKLKPLLLIIPLAVILAIALLLDNRVFQADSVSDAVSSSQQMTLNLIIGNAGSIDSDIGEPIYDAPDETGKPCGNLQYNCAVIASDSKSADTPAGWVAVELPGKAQHYYEDSGEPVPVGYVKTSNTLQRKVTIDCRDKTRAAIALNALDYVGLRFIKGGTSLDDGIDCSNYTSQIYGLAGVSIPTLPNDIKAAGRSISETDSKTGDVIYYDVNAGTGHVGIYLGDGYSISSMGHSGRTYPEGGVRIVGLKYRDRTQPEIITFIK